MLIDNLEQIPHEFKDGYRGHLLLCRNKDGQEGNAQRRAIKRISRSYKEWDEIVQDFRFIQQNSHPRHRIYSSVNPRNIQKAIHEFKRRQLEAEFANNFESLDFYTDIKNRFFSTFMNPNSRERSNFLIDCDTPEEYEYAQKNLDKSLILFEYPTKNGRHIITKPFNPNGFEIGVKKDDLIYIG